MLRTKVSNPVYNFEIVLESVHNIKPQEGCTYSIKWMRGDRRCGKSPQYNCAQSGIVVMQYTAKFTGTMLPKDKNRFHRKMLDIYVHENSNKKGKAEKRRIAELQADLSEYLNCSRRPVVLKDKKRGPISVMLSITSSLSKDGKGDDDDQHTDVAATGDSLGKSDDEDEQTARTEVSEAPDPPSLARPQSPQAPRAALAPSLSPMPSPGTTGKFSHSHSAASASSSTSSAAAASPAPAASSSVPRSQA
eukprot:RCo016603